MKICVPGENGKMAKFIRANAEHHGIAVTKNINDKDWDVMIDFTSPDALKKNIDCCLKRKAKLIVGTTGLHEEHFDRLKEASLHIPILLDSNMSIGMNAIFSAVKLITKALKDKIRDVNIVETHHKQKKDAPSGTAIKLASIITENADHVEPECASLRAHEVKGEHICNYFLDKEKITISHVAEDRSVFAEGAIAAAIWINSHKNGMYSMSDVLGA